jgi:uncharacterized protein YidB (DUF937 family)
MGLLDALFNQLGGGQQQQNALLSTISTLMANNGGLSGVLARFTQNGFGEHVDSWVKNGDNMPVTGDHVNQVFGDDQMHEVAQQLGTNKSQASSMIASILPGLVDKLTPNGQLVSNSQAQQGLSSLLSQELATFLGGSNRASGGGTNLRT